MMKNIPNGITLANLFAGCVALTITLKGDPETGAFLIIVCSILDFLDGAAAKMLNAHSETGKQLDSLADLISFGLAPSAIVFHYMDNSLNLINHGSSHFVWSYAAFFIAVFAALRLARFNIETEQKTYFTGLPTPASALLIASIPVTLALAKPGSAIVISLEMLSMQLWFNLGIVVILSALMISPFKMFSLKIKNFTWQDNQIRYVFFAACVILLITFGLAAIPLFMIFYILLSLLWPNKVNPKSIINK